MQTLSWKNVGPPSTPHGVKQLRKQVLDSMKYLGQPVVHMHIWNTNDVTTGLAKSCPACYDTTYGQVRNDCQVCYGTGFVSVENTTLGNYVNINGQLVTGDPGTGIIAPKFGGFGPRTLTWVIEPDKAVDVFKLTAQGALVKVQNADAYAAWYPDMHDNDLLVNVQLNHDLTVAAENLRFQLKMSTPMSIRGWGKKQQGLREYEYMAAQTFEMNLLPTGITLYSVPLDVPDQVEADDPV